MIMPSSSSSIKSNSKSKTPATTTNNAFYTLPLSSWSSSSAAASNGNHRHPPNVKVVARGNNHIVVVGCCPSSSGAGDDGTPPTGRRATSSFVREARAALLVLIGIFGCVAWVQHQKVLHQVSTSSSSTQYIANWFQITRHDPNLDPFLLPASSRRNKLIRQKLLHSGSTSKNKNAKGAAKQRPRRPGADGQEGGGEDEDDVAKINLFQNAEKAEDEGQDPDEEDTPYNWNLGDMLQQMLRRQQEDKSYGDDEPQRNEQDRLQAALLAKKHYQQKHMARRKAFQDENFEEERRKRRIGVIGGGAQDQEKKKLFIRRLAGGGGAGENADRRPKRNGRYGGRVVGGIRAMLNKEPPVPKWDPLTPQQIADIERSVQAYSSEHGGHDPCLIVYHIPKTGGLSLAEYLKQLASNLGWRYEPWHGFYGKFKDRDPNIAPWKRDKVWNDKRIHIGHLTPHFETLTRTTQCYKMTLLREPVDRSISAFYYHRHKTKEWEACFRMKCRLWWEYVNDVTRRFAAHHTAWNSYDTAKYLEGDTSRGLQPRALDDAKATLSKFDFICFLDDLDACVQDMARALGDTKFKVNQEQYKNVGKRRQEVDDTTKALIQQGNSFDVQLYQWAEENFRNGRNKDLPAAQQ